MFKNLSRIQFFWSSIQNIRSNCYFSEIFLKFFSIIFFWYKIYSFPVIFVCERFNFSFYFLIFCYSFADDVTRLLHPLNICYLFYWFIVDFLILIQSGGIWSMMIWIYIMTFIIQWINIMNDKLTTSHF